MIWGLTGNQWNNSQGVDVICSIHYSEYTLNRYKYGTVFSVVAFVSLDFYLFNSITWLVSRGCICFSWLVSCGCVCSTWLVSLDLYHLICNLWLCLYLLICISWLVSCGRVCITWLVSLDLCLLVCISWLHVITSFYGKGKIKLKLTPKESKLRHGQRLLLKCQVSGKPMPAIKWLKNKELLEANDHFNITVIKYVWNLLIRSEHSG